MLRIIANRMVLLSFLPILLFSVASSSIFEQKESSFGDAPPLETITIRPADMLLAGDAAVCDSTALNPSVQVLCAGMPAGSILLGVDPADANPAAWGSASAAQDLQFTAGPFPLVAVIKIDWPHDNKKGLISYLKGQEASVRWNGITVWNKRSLIDDLAGFFWGVQNETVLTTAVIRDSASQSLKIDVPAQSSWAIGQIQILIYPLPDHAQPGSLRGAAYTPYRDCQNPDWGPSPSETEIREDLSRLENISNGVRTYSSLGINGKIPALASDYHLPVCAGAMLGREKDSNGKPIPNKNREEIDGLVNLAKDPAVNLDCLIIGNEVLLFDFLSEDELISYIREVKAKVPGIPVATADVTELFLDHPNVVNELDWVLVHIYPYWNYQPIDQATQWVLSQYHRVTQKYPAKHVVIGETGWPSAGPDRGTAHPSLENQRTYFNQFSSAAEQEKIDYYYFSPTDEMWKREGGVGSHWGILYSDRTGKQATQSLLAPAQYLQAKKIYMPLIVQMKNTLQAWMDQALHFGSRIDPKDENSSRLAQALKVNDAEFWVYSDYISNANHFAPSGWIGDQSDLNLFECARTDLNSMDTSIQIQYNPKGPLGYAGVYWQEPANNWGTVQNRGYNLDNATELKFIAKGSQGGERIKIMIGGIWGEAPDSQQPALSTDVITLTNNWQEYSLDLRGHDLSHVIGGFGFTIDRCQNNQPLTVYLDNIRYLLSIDPGLPSPTPTPGAPYSFNVYSDQNQPGNHFSPSGSMGDVGDIQMDACDQTNPHQGSTAIRVGYKGLGIGPSTGCSGSQACKWASVYWQEPVGNWGTQPGSYDLSGAKGLTFWARGEKGGEWITFRSGGMNCGALLFPETFCPALSLDPDPIMLSTEWQQYTIPIPADVDTRRVSGAFLWAAAQSDNPAGATFYLDDIQFLFNQIVPRQAHSIYYGKRLSASYQMGVNTSAGQTDWVVDQNGFMRMNYPSGQDWGALFITYGVPSPFPRLGQDLSAYKTLTVDLRGQAGGEQVWLGLKDNTDPDDGSETLVDLTLTDQWQTFTIPLSSFTTADLTKLYVVTEFVFKSGMPAETVDFRNIRYLP